ncbi:MAG: DUF296 domain-containing protein [Proteobacteria bacterium]|nr:DUF296 domain-containing protein [Pseudomonadota bacterium]
MIIGKLRHNEDLLDELTRIAKEKDIKEGAVFVIGALKSAKLGYYDQTSKKYKEINLPYPQEIVSGIGNVSVKSGEVFIHLHLSLSDSDGNLKGGHLLRGCKIFACEYILIPSKGLKLSREYDEQTGLFLLKDIL